MVSTIERIPVLDDRIKQTAPKYAVCKGASSVSTQRYLANSMSTSVITWEVRVPSTAQFIDRKVIWEQTYYLSFPAVTTTPGAVCLVGDDLAPAPFCAHQAVQNFNAVINNESVNLQVEDVLNPLLRLTDGEDARRQRTCATKLEQFADMDNAYNSSSYSMAGFNTAPTRADVPNGAGSTSVMFTDATGNVLAGNGVASGVNYVNGIPQYTPGLAGNVHPIFVKIVTREPLVLPPFLWRDDLEFSEVGLYGILNATINAQLRQPNRCLKFSTERGTTVDASLIAFNSSVPGGAVQSGQLVFQFLTPSLQVPPPPQSIVPYMMFERFVQPLATIPSSSAVDPTAIATTRVTSPTWTMNTIPDFLIFYIKPVIENSHYSNDWVSGIRSLNITFNNQDGIASTYSQEQLYALSVKNGLNMSWPEWRGYAQHSVNGVVATTGSYLILKPGEDFALPPGLAPGVLGAFSIQFSMDVYQCTGADMVTPNLYLLRPTSGFFVSEAGSSKANASGILTQDQVLGVGNDSDFVSRMEARRAVGGLLTGGGILSSLGSMLSTAKSAFDKARPVLSAVRAVAGEIDHPAARKGHNVMKALGLGRSGGMRLSDMAE